MAPIVGTTLGHYKITERIGAGGMGVVYKARDTHLDRFVAIKVLPPERIADPDRKRRFVQEAKAASALNHPTAPVSINPGLPAELGRIINKALEKDRELRYQSAHEVWADLKRLKGDDSRRIPAAAVTPARRSRHWRAASIIAAIVAAAAMLIFWIVHRGAAPATEANSLVVLPCDVYGAKDAEFLSEAIPDSLSTLLSQVEGLETRRPPRVSEFEQVGRDLSKVATAYKVQRFVKASVTAELDEFVLNVQLLDSRDQRILWGNLYRGGRGNYSELVRRAAEDLRKKLQPAAPGIAATRGLAANSEAELLFQQGRYFSNRYNNGHLPADFDRSLENFQHALVADPKLADAAAEIAWLYDFKYEGSGPAEQTIPEMKRWAQRAVDINPRCGLGWSASAVAQMYSTSPDWQKAVTDALRAMVLAQNEPFAYAGFLTGQPTLTFALESYLQQHRLQPLYLYASANISQALMSLGRSGEGLGYADEVVSIEPKLALGQVFRSLILADLDRIAEASQSFEIARALIGQNGIYASQIPAVRLAIALQSHDLKSAETSQRDLLRFMDNPECDTVQMINLTLDLLPFLVRHGQMGFCWRLLKRHAELGAPIPYDWLMLSPSLEPIRKDPRFTSILESGRKQTQQLFEILRQAKARGELPRFLETPMANLAKKLSL